MWSKSPNYSKLFYQIRGRCRFQIQFSGSLLFIFFVLQYSVPISLVVLGSITSSREPLTSFVQTNLFPIEDSKESNAKEQAEALVTQIIFLLGVITILLGVINTTVRPAESYDTSSKFNTKFATFKDKLDLGILEFGGLPKNSDAINKALIEFLYKKSDELMDLINEYNEARSLSLRQANIKAVSQITDDKKEAIHTSNENFNVKDNNSGSIEKDSIISAESDDLKDFTSEINQSPIIPVESNFNGIKTKVKN